MPPSTRTSEPVPSSSRYAGLGMLASAAVALPASASAPASAPAAPTAAASGRCCPAAAPPSMLYIRQLFRAAGAAALQLVRRRRYCAYGPAAAAAAVATFSPSCAGSGIFFRSPKSEALIDEMRRLLVSGEGVTRTSSLGCIRSRPPALPRSGSRSSNVFASTRLMSSASYRANDSTGRFMYSTSSAPAMSRVCVTLVLKVKLFVLTGLVGSACARLNASAASLPSTDDAPSRLLSRMLTQARPLTGRVGMPRPRAAAAASVGSSSADGSMFCHNGALPHDREIARS
eukprot:scaffold3636_cov66-Phaeocystis_antarctica.AAC.1